jgi:hypothetical protein
MMTGLHMWMHAKAGLKPGDVEVAQAIPTGERLAGEILDRERERWLDDASPA